MFHHDTAGGMFPYGTGPTRKQVLNYNEDDPKADRYSILDKMEKYRRKDGLFHIRLCYPTYSELFPCNEWTQSSNFVEDTEITDFKEIELTYAQSYTDQDFPGLMKMTSWYKNYFWSSPFSWYFGVGYGYSGTAFNGAYGKPSVSVLDIYLAAGIITKFVSKS